MPKWMWLKVDLKWKKSFFFNFSNFFLTHQRRSNDHWMIVLGIKKHNLSHFDVPNPFYCFFNHYWTPIWNVIFSQKSGIFAKIDDFSYFWDFFDFHQNKPKYVISMFRIASWSKFDTTEEFLNAASFFHRLCDYMPGDICIKHNRNYCSKVGEKRHFLRAHATL